MNYISNINNVPARVAEAVLQWVFPLSTYCLCCGKPVDSARSYSICDHCIHHITWGNIHIDLEAESRRLGRPPQLDSAVACVKYGLYERRLIFDLKYDGRTYVARAIADIMADRLAAERLVSPTTGDVARQLCKAAKACKLPCNPDSRTDTAARSRPTAPDPNYASSRLTYSTGLPGSCGGFDYIVPVPVHRDREKARGFNQAEKISRHLGGRIGVPVLPRAIIRKRNTAKQRSLSAEDRYFNLEGAFSLNPSDGHKIKGSRILLLDDVYTTGATAHRCGAVLKEAGAARVNLIAFATGNDFAYGFFDDKQRSNGCATR